MTNLIDLYKLHPSSKLDMGYIETYDHYFLPFKNKDINILEIGVANGDSLKIWRDYFTKANICGFDIVDNKLNIKNVDILIGDQTDSIFLKTIIDKYKHFDIIIDDGSHVSKHIVKSFNFLFPYLKKGGLYIVEDLQTSYFPRFGGSRININKKNTSMNFLKKLCDSVNYENFDRPFYKKNKFDGKVQSISFYQNIAFIRKNNSRTFLYQGKKEGFIELIKKNISRFF
jgi:hypothetical protein